MPATLQLSLLPLVGRRAGDEGPPPPAYANSPAEHQPPGSANANPVRGRSGKRGCNGTSSLLLPPSGHALVDPGPAPGDANSPSTPQPPTRERSLLPLVGRRAGVEGSVASTLALPRRHATLATCRATTPASTPQSVMPASGVKPTELAHLVPARYHSGTSPRPLRHHFNPPPADSNHHFKWWIYFPHPSPIPARHARRPRRQAVVLPLPRSRESGRG